MMYQRVQEDCGSFLNNHAHRLVVVFYAEVNESDHELVRPLTCAKRFARKSALLKFSFTLKLAQH